MRFWFFLIATALAVAGGAITVHASELSDHEDSWIGSESESIGTFGSDDNSAYDSFEDLLDSMDDVGMDFVEDDDFEVSDDLSIDSVFDQEDFVEVFDSDSDDYVIDFSDSDDDGISLLSSYNAYYGSISSTYVEYMRGYLSKLEPNEHYLGARVGQYDYIFVWGENLYYSDVFTGDGVNVIHWNTYNQGNFYYEWDSDFYLSPGSYLVYSDLSVIYPGLATSSDMTLRQLLILCTIVSLVCTMIHMYQVRKIRRVNSSR